MVVTSALVLLVGSWAVLSLAGLGLMVVAFVMGRRVGSSRMSPRDGWRAMRRVEAVFWAGLVAFVASWFPLSAAAELPPCPVASIGAGTGR
jgi:hypothetical protein